MGTIDGTLASTPSDTAGRRLSPLDASFLYLERPTEPLHVGSIALLEATVPFEAFAAELDARLAALPGYRQRPVRPLLDLDVPRWEDDPGYDPRYHVQRVVLPPPGDVATFHRVVDGLFGAVLDPRRPLWETYLIEGLPEGRAAILSKVHHCMIDGVSGAKVLEVMTEAAAGGAARAPARAEAEDVGDRCAPVSRGVSANGMRPGTGVVTSVSRSLLGVGSDVLAGVRTALGVAAHPVAALDRVREAAEAASMVATVARERIEPWPFNGTLGSGRRIVWASFHLDDFLAMRGAAGCKVNDVALAVITGALRRYLQGRGAALDHRVRALIPVNVRRGDDPLALGNRVSAMFATLPVDLADPILRLREIATQMHALKDRGQARAFELALAAAGALPAPMAPLIARASALRPLVHTVCTNVPGPREARYILGRRILEMHPIVPIAIDMGVGFAILSYDRTLSISATTDPALVPDAERLSEALAAAADELAACLGVTRVAAARATVPDGARARGGGASAATVPAAAAPCVGDLMTPEPTTVAPAQSLAGAWEIMRARRIRHLPVVGPDGRLVGLVTQRDLLAAADSSLAFRRVEDRVRLLGRASVADVMETHVSVVLASEPAAEAGRRMAGHKIGCLPVVGDDGRLAGIVTEEDFLRWATEHMAAPV